MRRKIGSRNIEQGPFDEVGIEARDEYGRQEEKAAKDRVEKEYGKYGVVVERQFFKYLVHTQQGCRDEGKNQPHNKSFYCKNSSSG